MLVPATTRRDWEFDYSHQRIMTLGIGTRLGHFEIIGSLGAGGMGQVYRARDARLGRDVAVKILSPSLASDPAFLARFAVEARAVAALSHPNILALFDVGEDGGTAYAVTELLEGETLRERLHAGPLPLRKAVDYSQQIAGAIGAAHERGIVHRDLKPENIFVTSDGRIKVLDFGVAQMAVPLPSGDATTAVLTSDGHGAGTVLGSVGYMAPEQARGLAVDHRADIFSLGCILYELVTGRSAFQRDTPADTIAALLHTDPPPLTATPAAHADAIAIPQAERIVRRCLEKAPAERFQSARDLAFALEMLSGTGAQTADSPARTRPAWIAAGAVIAAAALGALAGITVWGGSAVPGERGQTIRFGIPASITWSDAASVSPDGRYIIYTGGLPPPGAGGQPSAPRPHELSLSAGRFWLRSLDTLDQHRLTGTETAVPMFFWSPDSRHLGYRVAHDLVIREVPGGPPRILAKLASPPQGVAWSRSGDLVVAMAGGIYRMPAGGGPPALILRTEPGRELWRGWPAFLPDGDRFLFTVLTSGVGEQALETRVATLDGRELGTVLTGAVGASYADGYLIFGAGARLYAQPFDPQGGTLSGRRVQLAEDVAQDWRAGRLDARASETGVLVFRSAPRDDAQFVLVDRYGRSIRSIGAPDNFTNFSISPDEKRIIAARRDPLTGRVSLWLIDVARGVTSMATDPRDGEDADDPTWTRDGQRVAYRRGSTLVIRAAHGGVERTLVASEAYPDAFSPDGRYLFYGQPRENAYELWSLDLESEGAVPTPLVTNVTLADEARVSPDGRWVAYHSNETGMAQVYVQPFPSTGEKRQVSQAGGVQPRWSVDGHELFYLDPDGKLMSVRMAGSDPRSASAPAALFSTGLLVSDALDQYAPVRSGFVIRAPVSSGADAAGVQIVINWKGVADAGQRQPR